MAERFQFSLRELLAAMGWCAAGSFFGHELLVEVPTHAVVYVPGLWACLAAAMACLRGKVAHSLLVAPVVFLCFFCAFLVMLG